MVKAIVGRLPVFLDYSILLLIYFLKFAEAVSLSWR
jgi:hypothetical protein